MSNMDSFLNPKLLEMLAGVDKEKLAQINNIVSNMSRDDLANLVSMLKNSNNDNNN